MADHDRMISDGVTRDGSVPATRPYRAPPSAGLEGVARRDAWYAPIGPVPAPRPAPEKPASVVLGVRCGLVTGSVWLLASLFRLPSELWGAGYGHSGFWAATALFGAVVILLSLAAGARSAKAWLLLQLSNALITFVTAGAAFTLLSSYRNSEDDWMALLCVLTGPLQLLAMVLLNRRAARKWCRVDPEGYRIVL